MLKKIVLTAFLLLPLALPLVAGAQFNDGLSDAGSAAYGSSAVTDPARIIGLAINALLGVLGVVFLILVIYAGFLWMTAAGDNTQVGRAKNIITTAVVGLVILLSAYAISDFVVRQLTVATGTG